MNTDTYSPHSPDHVNPREGLVATTMGDISTTNSKCFAAFPFKVRVLKVTTIIQNAIATANSIVTVKNHAGTSLGTITVAFTGSAIGDQDFLAIATSNNDAIFEIGEAIQCITNGASTTSCLTDVMIHYVKLED